MTVAAKPKLSAQERRYAGWLPASRETTPALEWWSMPDEVRELYVAVGRELISRSNVIDLSEAFESISETSFIDWMHLSEFGNMCLSRILYDKLK